VASPLVREQMLILPTLSHPSMTVAATPLFSLRVLSLTAIAFRSCIDCLRPTASLAKSIVGSPKQNVAPLSKPAFLHTHPSLPLPFSE
jgi:hypothetical protein